MADELDQELDKNPVEGRIKDLSGKVKLTAEERDKALAEKAEAETKAAEAQKRAEFAEGFADMLSQNPAAKDFKADIQAKVMAGMSLEDATFAVLGKAGKLGAPAFEPQSPIGGSAATPITRQSEKPVSEMTQEERRAEIIKAFG